VLLIILVGVSAWFLTTNNQKEKDDELAYTELIKKVDAGEVEKVEMTVGSTSVKVKIRGEEEGKEKKTIVPNTQAFIELIQEKTLKGNEIELVQKKQNPLIGVMQTLFSLLPTLILIGLVIILFKMQGLGDKGKVYDAETTKSKIKFDDVAGLEEEKSEMIEIVDFLKSR